jgi:hypothetical protein
MSFGARPLIISGIGEESVKAKADEKWLTNLVQLIAYISVGVVIACFSTPFGFIPVSAHQRVKYLPV